MDIFGKTQPNENSKIFKTQPILSAKLGTFFRKLSFPATLFSESETKNSKNSTKLTKFVSKLSFPANALTTVDRQDLIRFRQELKYPSEPCLFHILEPKWMDLPKNYFIKGLSSVCDQQRKKNSHVINKCYQKIMG